MNTRLLADDLVEVALVFGPNKRSKAADVISRQQTVALKLS
jgi:hypothetical protein